jgi:hypothetical protein
VADLAAWGWQRLEDKKAHFIAVVKHNQPLLHVRIKTRPWRQVPAGITVREIG